MSKIALEGNASGTGTLTIASQNTNSNFTLTLPNSSGTVVVTGGAQTIEFAAGTVSAPSITTTGDTNTGIFFPAADTIAFTEGGAEAMRIDSDGDVGIGTTSPSHKLDVVGTGDVKSSVATTSSGSGANCALRIATDSDGKWLLQTGNAISSGLRFYDEANNTERMRIDSSGTITYTQTTLANYQWSSWNPSDNTGTVTTAPNTGTTDDSNYVTMSNSSGTLTITFDVAGKYLISLTQQTKHASTYTYETFYFNLGGTATRRLGPSTLDNWGEPANDGDTSITTSFYVSATASQTLTVQPQYRLSGAGSTINYVAYANATILYSGG